MKAKTNKLNLKNLNKMKMREILYNVTALKLRAIINDTTYLYIEVRINDDWEIIEITKKDVLDSIAKYKAKDIIKGEVDRYDGLNTYLKFY